MQGPPPDSLRAVLDSVFANKAYRWIERPDPFAAWHRAIAALRQWLDNLRDLHPLGYRVFLFLLIAIFVAFLVHVAWALLHKVDGGTPQDGIDAARNRVARDEAWYRRESERLAAAGLFVDAMQADFHALILRLDARSLLRFHPSKTPAEYVRESQLAPEARAELRELVRRLYGFAFARWPCGPAEFADWRARAAPERYAPTH